MNTKQAVVVVTIHAGDHSRAVFGPFANGDAASDWGFRNFPNNTAPSGHTVTWCWEEIASTADDVAAFIEASIN